MKRSKEKSKSRSTMPTGLMKAFFGDFDGNLFEQISTPSSDGPHFIADFCRTVLDDAPGHIVSLTLLADVLSNQGEHGLALDAELRLSELVPDDEVVRYNIACSYALTGHREEAFQSLRKAIQLGYKNLKHLRNDRDLAVLKSDSRYQALVRGLESELRAATGERPDPNGATKIQS